MNGHRPTPLLAALALLAFHSSARAREVTVLAEDLCGACSIELTPDVLLGADGESVIGVAWDIQRLSDGRFTMAFQDVMYEFTVFSPDGSKFQRVGREGEGPGEYAHVWWVREHGDGVHVFDRRRRRLTVLGSGFEVVRTAPVPCLDCNGWDMAILPDGSVALNYFMPSGPRDQIRSAKAGFAIHILGQDGETLRELDEIAIKEFLTPAEDSDRFLQVAPDGSLLSAHLTRYRIDRWDPVTGKLLETLVRVADWIPKTERAGEPTGPDHPPATRIWGMHLDEAGRLWSSIARPSPDWRGRLERTDPAALGWPFRDGVRRCDV